MVDLELAQTVVDYMNDLSKRDRQAVAALISNRVPCNQDISNHPTCQVVQQCGGFSVGLLGILNGLCGIYNDGPRKGYGPVAAEFDSVGEGRELVGFRVLRNE